MPAESLDPYDQKRDFDQTPEPNARKSKKKRGNEPVFVIHRHDARNLHYDLRLEMEGVLNRGPCRRGSRMIRSKSTLRFRRKITRLSTKTFTE